jgi:hypothetical protein
MSALSPSQDYEFGQVASGLLAERLPSLPALTEPLSRSNAEGLAIALARNALAVGDLAKTSPQVREMLVVHRAFALSRSNVVTIVGGPESLGLDSIMASSTDAAGYVLAEIEQYLRLLDESEPPAVPLDNGDRLTELLDLDLTGADLQALLRRCRADVILADLSDAPSSTFSSLALTRRFAPTARNVLSYVVDAGRVDEALSDFLTRAPNLTDSDALSNEELVTLAEAIANAAAINPLKRIHLISGLQVVGPLEVTRLRAIDGALLAFMLETGLLPDAASTFNSLSRATWPTKEAGIAASADFADYLGGVKLSEAEFENLLDSDRVPSKVKDAVIAGLDAFAPALTSHAATGLAEYAVGNRVILAPQRIEMLRGLGAESEPLAGLIGLSVDSMDGFDLVASVRSLGGEYAKLTEATGLRATLAQTVGVEKILDRLRSQGSVSSWSLSDDGRVRVNMRRS